MGENFYRGTIVDDKKLCNICKVWLPLTDYSPNPSCNGGVTGTCRICSRVRVAKWYKDNRNRRQEYANIRNRKRKKEAIKDFGGKCQDCDGVFQDCVYDFHHIGGKDVNPSAAMAMAKERRDKELSKCILLCANCHRIRHYGNSDMTEGKEARGC